MNGASMDVKQQKRESIAANKRQLQDELRKIQEQKAALERKIEELKQRGIPIPAPPPAGALYAAGRPGSASQHVSPGAAAAHAVAGKRAAPMGAAAALDHPNKKQRILDQRRQRVRDIFKQCKSILAQLKKNTNAHIFAAPVDPERSGAKDYYKIITKPMDMGTVGKKLEKNQYTSPLDFATDMRQIWINCKTYNPATTPVAMMGSKMEAAWEQKWQVSGIEQKWATELAVQQQEEAVSAPPACLPGILSHADVGQAVHRELPGAVAG